MIRLDDLEALALMVNFEYDGGHNSPIDSRLGSLFLTHDALVLLTLQARVQTYSGSTGLQNGCSLLAKAEERHMLLFWHVYGLDAFHCLDTRKFSRIRDDHVEAVEQLPLSESGGYLDAILALAVIARKTLATFCSPQAKPNGVQLNEVLALYQELDQWHNKTCPPHLRWQAYVCSHTESCNTEKTSSSAKASRVTRLQRAVLAILELNCYMQIESSALQCASRGRPGLEGEVLELRVEYETLHQISELATFFQWMAADQSQNHQIGPSLADLAPNILRNVCTGVCVWLCLRVQATQHGGLPEQLTSRIGPGQKSQTEGEEKRRQQIANHAVVASTLRSAVASAISHSDTERMVAHLDELLKPLMSYDGAE